MKPVLAATLSILVLASLALLIWRMLDHRSDRVEMARLVATQPPDPQPFARGMIAGLPEPARRYFAFAIREGTPLHTVAEIEMTGKFSLGTRDAPNYLSMRATQILAAPTGFVWKMAAWSGAFRVSGSDSGSWTRFWLAGLIPVARAGGNADHARSALGRYLAEAVFWSPAALLPGPGIRWHPVDDRRARVSLRRGDMEQSVEITVDDLGRLTRVALDRWTNANADRVYRVQPFGGFLSDYAEFSGFRLPTHVEAGNHFATEAYFPFFVADVTRIRFPRP